MENANNTNQEDNETPKETLSQGTAPPLPEENKTPAEGAAPPPVEQNSATNIPVTDISAEQGQPAAPSLGIKQTVVSGPPKKSKKKLVLTLLIVLLLAAAGAAAYLLLNKKDGAPVTQTSQETREVEVVRIGTTDGPANNLFPKEGIGISYVMNRQVYEGLVGSDDGRYVPLLASSWTNPDEKTWVFKLKPNVKFHSGKNFIAADVKASIEALQKLDFLGYIVATIDTVEVVNDLEIKITTTEPDALLLNRLAIAYITDQDAADAEGNNGTGPYVLDKTATYDETTATLVAQDNYHGGRPKTRKLVYNIYTSDEEMNTDLKENRLDMVDTIPSDKAIAGLDEAGFTKIEFAAPGTFGVYLNMLRDGSPLTNKEVRRALSQAFNRQGLVDELASDNVPATQVVPKSLPGHDASTAFPEFNAAAAKETLAKAGYPNGVTLDFVYVREIQPDPPILIKQLEAAGFTINELAFDEVDPVLDLVFAGGYDLFSAAYTSDLADSRDLLGALLESTEQSYPVYKDAAFDKLLEDSDRELDPTKRIAILQEANRYITDNFLWIPLRSTAYVSYFKPELDITPDYNGGGSPGVYFWKVGQKVAD